MATVVVTGSEGLVGTALMHALRGAGYAVRGLDLRAAGAARGDTRVTADVARAIEGADGVVHLAAVSRVVWGERDPDGCWATNVGGTDNVVAACARAPGAPWLVFVSSREVYGQATRLPVDEDAPLVPMNVYGRSKVEGERRVDSARSVGHRTAIVRLANVYGSVVDHADRVVPAFARAALAGRTLRVDGAEHTFDFTYIDDAVDGLMRVVERVSVGAVLPPVHLLPGRAVTLGELAALAIELAGTQAQIVAAPPRSYDVARFVGDPRRAERLLGGWRAKVPVREGLGRLIAAYRAAAGAP